MGWAVGWDSDMQRFRGYGVPCICEYPDCTKEIDRGVSYACAGECGRYFCDSHLWLFNPGEKAGWFCEPCQVSPDPDPPHPVKPEVPQWLEHVLTHWSWERWRNENPELAEDYRKQMQWDTSA